MVQRETVAMGSEKVYSLASNEPRKMRICAYGDIDGRWTVERIEQSPGSRDGIEPASNL